MPAGVKRASLVVRGAVQGVGFRPFIYQLASEFRLCGWVLNSPQGVFIEAEGTHRDLTRFLLSIEKRKPPRASIQSLEYRFLDPIGYTSFEIRPSNGSGEMTVLVLPDIRTCSECLSEVFDPGDRRYLYPFTNCTHCGPRFTIMEALPYDRANTTMKKFKMCDECQQEYASPEDRRFHAQPNACPRCGPHLELWGGSGKVLLSGHEALLKAAGAIRAGAIVAVKGIGGFHLFVDARSDEAVTRLRKRKNREEKPFALMFPGIGSVKEICEVSELEERLLFSPEAPVVLLNRFSESSGATLASSISPRNPCLGVMLPYTPLHHILMKEVGFPVVATSGNLSDEPICIDEREALRRLAGVADLFLVHNRPIIRPVDDSVVRVMMGRESILRRSRGYAPLPVPLKGSAPCILAVGGHLKNTVAVTVGRNTVVSQHIGDLETKEAYQAFQKCIGDLQSFYQAKPERLVCDLHPDYLSTRFAKGPGIPLVSIQHHHAHVASCMAEHDLTGTVLGVSWDGSGYGPDGTLWGGEFLLADEAKFHRVASFRHFRLPGSAAAFREPRRTALGILYKIFGRDVFNNLDLFPLRSFSPSERALLLRMLSGGINSPRSSSVGRLFDAVASLLGLIQRVSFEGQAAMELEFAISGYQTDGTYPFEILNRALSPPSCRFQWMVHWEAMIMEIIGEVRRGVAASEISARFHNTLVEVMVAVAKRVGEQRVVLSGGCFQNRYLTERAVQRLETGGFRPYWHQRVPTHDGGIALGQVYAALGGLRNG